MIVDSSLSTLVPNFFFKEFLGTVSERGMAEIMSETGSFDDARIKMFFDRSVLVIIYFCQQFSETSTHLSNLQRMSQAVVMEVRLSRARHLCHVLQSTKGSTVQDLVTVPFIRASLVFLLGFSKITLL